MNTDYIESYIQFVEKMIGEYKKIGNLVDDQTNEITSERINTALSLYYNITLALNAEYQRQKINYESESIDFKIWEDEKFEVAKQEVLDEYFDTKIKPSVKEFETRLRTKFKSEWKDRTLSLTAADARVRFLLRMMDTLQRYDSILTTISYNMRSELRSLSLDGRMNATPEGVMSNKTRGERVPVMRRVVDE